MVCKICGTDIADKAIVCYRCGAATAEKTGRPAAAAPAGRAVRTVLAFVVVIALIAAGVLLLPLTPHGAPRILGYAALMLVTFVALRLIIGPARR